MPFWAAVGKVCGSVASDMQVAKAGQVANHQCVLPAELYNYYYNNTALALMVITFLVYGQGMGKITVISGYNRSNLWLISIITILFIGTRPVSSVFVDMTTYAQSYELTAATGQTLYPDWLFNSLNRLMADSFSVETFFLVCSILYVVPLAWASQRVHKEWALAALLAFIGAFSFFAYGVNGLRNGIATSLVILAIAFSDRKIIMGLLMVAAAGFHKSALLPIAAFLLTQLNSTVSVYSTLWLACLILASISGERLAPAIVDLVSLGDDTRLEGYSQGTGEDRGGYRLDFILYSIVPVILTYLLADRAKRLDIFYRRILCTYLAANAFWLIVMYAAYSNRFAYLSWFLMPWVIIYPFIPIGKQAQGRALGAPIDPRLGLLGMALVVHHIFTYIMAVFVYPAAQR